MRFVIALFLLCQVMISAQVHADSAYSLFGEIGGTFSLKEGSRVLDDRGGVIRVGAVYNPLFLMAGVAARGAQIEASHGDSYALGNIGIFGGFSLFQGSPVRLRLFLPVSFGKIKPTGGAAAPADNSVWFFEPEAQISYHFAECCALGFGLNHRFAYSYSGKPDQNDFIEKLMFTGAFSYEIPF